MADQPHSQRNRNSFDIAMNVVVGVAIATLLAAFVSNQFFPGKVPFPVVRGFQIVGWVGVVLYALMLAYQNRALLAAMARHKRTASGGNSLVQAVIFLAILGVLDFLSTRHHWRFDLTSNHQYSLSEQTKKILRGLKDDVDVTAFFVPNNPSTQQAEDLLKEYTYVSPHFKLTEIDPERDPLKARQLIQKYQLAKNGYFQNNTIVFDHDGHTTTLTGFSEQDFTAGLLKVTEDHPQVVYFLAGHGEADPDSYTPAGAGQLKDALTKQNYQVQHLDLFTEAKPAVPSDAAVVVVDAPQRAIDPRELGALTSFIQDGGKVMVMLDPSAPDTGLGSWLSSYGVTPQHDLVLDMQKNLWGNPAVVAAIKDSYQFHTITQSFTNASIATFYPQSESLAVADKLPAGVSVSPLVETSANSWGLTDPGTRANIDPSKDLRGPLKVVVAVTYQPAPPAPEKGEKTLPPQPKQGRLVVFGDSQFAMDNLVQRVPANQDFFLSSLNWLAEDDALVSIPPKDNPPRTVELTGSRASTIFYASMGSPLVLFALGGLVWWRRR